MKKKKPKKESISEDERRLNEKIAKLERKIARFEGKDEDELIKNKKDCPTQIFLRTPINNKKIIYLIDPFPLHAHKTNIVIRYEKWGDLEIPLSNIICIKHRKIKEET